MRKHDLRLALSIFIIAIHLLAGCGGSTENGTEPPEKKGNVRLQLTWQDIGAPEKRVTRNAVDCGLVNIEKIEILILSKEGSELIRGGPYDCADGSATLEDVPSGEERIVIALAKDAQENIVYRGQTGNVKIEPKKIAAVDVIVTSFVPQLIAGHNKTMMAVPIVGWTNIAQANEYELYLSQNPDMSAAVTVQAHAIPYTLTDYTAGLTYYWQVSAIDGLGNRGGRSPIGQFSTTDIPELIFPINGQAVSPQCSTMFKWSPIPKATGYRVFVNATDDFDSDAVASFDTSVASWSLGNAQIDGTFYWKVHTLDVDGNLGGASDISSATVKAVSRVTDVYPGDSSYPYELHSMGEQLFFVARAPMLDYRYNFELFIIDGLQGSEEMLKDIHPNDVHPGSRSMPAPFDMVRLNNWVYFIGNDGTNGKRIWQTDGTSANTKLLAVNSEAHYSNPSNLTFFKDKIYFTAESVNHGRELWATDGSAEGTQQIKDIHAGSEGSYPTELTVAGNWLYLKADDGIHGYEVWKTNGATTEIAKDVYEGKESSHPAHFVAVGDRFLFTANDGQNGSSNHEVWMSYETADEHPTLMLTEINADAAINKGQSYPSFLTAVNETLVALSGYHPDTGQEVYLYDLGEANPTPRRLTDTPEGDGHPANFTAAGEKLYFTASDENRIEQLWVIDLGNLDSPSVNLTAGIAIRAPRHLTAFGDRLYFSADDDQFGRELWTTTGTPNSTEIKADIFPGKSGSDPANITVHGSKLIFTAFNENGGEELFQLCQ